MKSDLEDAQYESRSREERGTDARSREGRPPGIAARARRSREVSLLRLANIVLRDRWLVAGCAALVVAVVATLTLLSPRSYSTTAQFLPQTRKMPNNVSGIAAQFGIALPTSDPGQSPQFYVELMSSRAILDSLAQDTTFRPSARMTAVGARGPLAAYYGIGERDAGLRRERVIRRLRQDIKANASSNTGVVNVSVRAPDPALAEQIGDRLLRLLEAFNRGTRKSQATTERQFTESRLAEVSADLRAAEQRMLEFQSANRSIGDGPALQLREERLRRDLTFRQQIYQTLAQSFEQARLEEIRDSPLITIIQAPDLPAAPDPRYVILKVVLAGVFGVLVGTLVAALRDFFGGADRDESTEVQEFSTLWRATRADFRHPIRALGRTGRVQRPEPASSARSA